MSTNMRFKKYAIPEDAQFAYRRGRRMPVLNMVTATSFVAAYYAPSYDSWANAELLAGNPVTDADITQIRGDMETSFEEYGVVASAETVLDAVKYACQQNRFDPLVSYLNGCKSFYDEMGQPPVLDRVMVDYLGCADTPYTRTATELMFYGLIGRALHPGLKFDYMLIISGEQGQGKSTLLSRLGGEFYDHSMSIDMFGTEQGLERLYKGMWLAEVQEMSRMGRVDENTLKQFLSTTSDDYRPKYARMVKSLPRRTVFVGTTNQHFNLFSDTVNRRFFILECNPARQTKKSWEMTSDDVRLILGEAMSRFPGTDVEKLLSGIGTEQSEITRRYVLNDENLTDLTTYLSMPLPENWDALDLPQRSEYYTQYAKHLKRGEKLPADLRPQISIPEIWCEKLGNPLGKMDVRTSSAIGHELRSLGYTHRERCVIPIYGEVYVYHA